MLYALRGVYLSKVHDGLKRYTICKMVDHMCGRILYNMSSATYFPAIFFCRFWHRNQENANKNFPITWNLQFFQSTFIERGKKPMLPSIMGQNRIQFLLKQGKMWKLSKLEWASECWLVESALKRPVQPVSTWTSLVSTWPVAKSRDPGFTFLTYNQRHYG